MQKRQDVLLAVDPNLNEKKHTEAHFGYKFRESDYWREARKLLSNHLVPFLNLEALKKIPSRLMSLLEVRVKYSPEEWAPSDSRLLTFP